MSLEDVNVANAFRRRRMVYFDDKPITLESTIDIMEKRLFYATMGYQALGEVPDFLAAAQTRQIIPDLILMDLLWDTQLNDLALLQRPDLRWITRDQVGIRLIRALREANEALREVPVLICSEYASLPDSEIALLRGLGGPVEFIAKNQIDSNSNIGNLETVLGALGLSPSPLILRSDGTLTETAKYIKIVQLIQDTFGFVEADLPAIAGADEGRIFTVDELQSYISTSRDSRERIEIAFFCTGALLELYSQERLREMAVLKRENSKSLRDIILHGEIGDLYRLKSDLEFRLGGSIR